MIDLAATLKRVAAFFIERRVSGSGAFRRCRVLAELRALCAAVSYTTTLTSGTVVKSLKTLDTIELRGYYL